MSNYIQTSNVHLSSIDTNIETIATSSIGVANATGTHLNIFTSQAVVNGTVSSEIDLLEYKTVALYGDSDADIQLNIQGSPDATNWYPSNINISTGSGSWYSQFDFAPRHIRLKSGSSGTITITGTTLSADSGTITATLSAKK